MASDSFALFFTPTEKFGYSKIHQMQIVKKLCLVCFLKLNILNIDIRTIPLRISKKIIVKNKNS